MEAGWWSSFRKRFEDFFEIFPRVVKNSSPPQKIFLKLRLGRLKKNSSSLSGKLAQKEGHLLFVVDVTADVAL
jgi:hypothetical protein